MYGKLPDKLAEEIPWNKLCVYLIVPYIILQKDKKENLHLKAVTMINPVTGWFEIAQHEDKRAISIANLVKNTWLYRYPRPIKITYDQGKKFIGHEFRKPLIKIEYGITAKIRTLENPIPNIVLEMIHQILGKLVRTFNISTQTYIDGDDLWTDILSTLSFAIPSTTNRLNGYSPVQLIFHRDMILPIKHRVDWELIRQQN